MKEKRSISRDFFILSILTVVTVTVWMAIDVFQTLNKTDSVKIMKGLDPLAPKIDTSVLDSLEAKNYYEIQAYQPVSPPISETVPQEAASPSSETVTPTPAIEAATPEATAEGNASQ